MFIDILKITIPALIVAVTAYLVIREMLSKQFLIQEQKIRQERQSTTLPLRMQAYERMSLLIERLSLSGLILRNQNTEMNAATFRVALLLAVQQEFEHNISQQIYVSDKLWEIIKATRDDLLQFINIGAEKVARDAAGQELAAVLLAMAEHRESDPIATAQMAIRREASLLF